MGSGGKKHDAFSVAACEDPSALMPFYMLFVVTIVKMTVIMLVFGPPAAYARTEAPTCWTRFKERAKIAFNWFLLTMFVCTLYSDAAKVLALPMPLLSARMIMARSEFMSSEGVRKHLDWWAFFAAYWQAVSTTLWERHWWTYLAHVEETLQAKELFLNMLL
eukprot:CAMPEP_0171275756 /NCGR_PEP_ID=MMETSP0790-20130122/63488_1 /TAXON_ID=2925 /ORGANISM="Alexandrium catenella, Strain OF101" /LENGTH=161 /DNA_ID=CAMNT_0011744833 /DNA_START=68 /DNA_END=553 /DNA_ORIENTATION=-